MVSIFEMFSMFLWRGLGGEGGVLCKWSPAHCWSNLDTGTLTCGCKSTAVTVPGGGARGKGCIQYCHSFCFCDGSLNGFDQTAEEGNRKWLSWPWIGQCGEGRCWRGWARTAHLYSRPTVETETQKWEINSRVLCSLFHRLAVVTGGQCEFRL